MSYGYVVLVGQPSGLDRNDSFEGVLRALGMRLRLTSDHARVFTTAGTSAVWIPGGGVILGDLFTRDFRRLGDGTALPDMPHGVPVCKHIVERYWGEYLAVLPATEDARELTLLRDPSGGMPCLYSVHEGTGFATSDVSIAIALGLYRKRIDWNFISHCLAYTHLKTQRTALTTLRELLPGTSLTVRGRKLATELIWSPWDFVARERRYSDPRAAADTVRETTAAVVAAWAETDRSVLMELSGGLDSSIVAACLIGTGARVTCCTLVTPVPGADERAYAAQVAAALRVPLEVEHLRVEHAWIDFVPRSEAVIPRVAALQYAINAVMETVADREDVASLYGGGGGDTVFCYLNTASPIVDALKERGIRAALGAIRDLSELYQCTRWHAGRLALRKLRSDAEAAYPPDTSFLNPDIVPVVPDSHPWFKAPAHALPGDRERIFDLAGTQLFRDGAFRGRRRRLRLPLLSQPIVECCLSIPTWFWNRGGVNRSVARAAFAGRLPDEIINRRSKGNFVHYTGAVYQKNKAHIRSFLLDGQLRAHNLLDSEALESFLDAPLRARDETFLRVLDLCMIENWIRHQA